MRPAAGFERRRRVGLMTERAMRDVEGFILAGGASSRMGADKAGLRLGGETFVERVARALGAVAGSVRVVSGRHEGDAWGLPVVPDVFEHRGALGGIHAALAHARAEGVLVVSCDLPFVTSELFARLVRLSEDGPEKFDAVAPVQRDGRAQPLCSFYARGACLARAEELLRAGESRPRLLLRRARTRWVAEEELSDLQDSALFFLNVNTPDEYARAVALHGDRGGGDAATRRRGGEEP